MAINKNKWTKIKLLGIKSWQEIPFQILECLIPNKLFRSFTIPE